MMRSLWELCCSRGRGSREKHCGPFWGDKGQRAQQTGTKPRMKERIPTSDGLTGSYRSEHRIWCSLWHSYTWTRCLHLTLLKSAGIWVSQRGFVVKVPLFVCLFGTVVGIEFRTKPMSPLPRASACLFVVCLFVETGSPSKHSTG